MPDRLRESLFNVLGSQVVGKVFVDLYAGSGAVGLEALSRGASQTIFVESNHAASRVIEENLASLGAEEDALLIHSQVKTALGRIWATFTSWGRLIPWPRNTGERSRHWVPPHLTW